MVGRIYVHVLRSTHYNDSIWLKNTEIKMNYKKWLAEVPHTITGDRLWQSEVYRLALFMGDLAWHDSRKLVQDRSMISLADQLYRATGSISANISEGFSRISGRDQARYYEYALGSAREARDWYFKARHTLGPVVTEHRLNLLSQIIRHLLTMIPKYRSKQIKEEGISYETNSYQFETMPLSKLFENIPLPE